MTLEAKVQVTDLKAKADNDAWTHEVNQGKTMAWTLGVKYEPEYEISITDFASQQVHSSSSSLGLTIEAINISPTHGDKKTAWGCN